MAGSYSKQHPDSKRHAVSCTGWVSGSWSTKFTGRIEFSAAQIVRKVQRLQSIKGIVIIDVEFLQSSWWLSMNMIKSHIKVNTTRAIQNMNPLHSTFCQFLNIMEFLYLLSEVRFVVFKLFHYTGVLPENGVPCKILISLVVFTLVSLLK